uniref:Uncharacterized protein n=1 Tax=Plectus sambesii TaxID=2011161 RepID=A0A914W151_9BILA
MRWRKRCRPNWNRVAQRARQRRRLRLFTASYLRSTDRPLSERVLRSGRPNSSARTAAMRRPRWASRDGQLIARTIGSPSGRDARLNGASFRINHAPIARMSSRSVATRPAQADAQRRLSCGLGGRETKHPKLVPSGVCCGVADDTRAKMLSRACGPRRDGRGILLRRRRRPTVVHFMPEHSSDSLPWCPPYDDDDDDDDTDNDNDDANSPALRSPLNALASD